MNFDRKTLEKLSVTKDWAWGGLRFLEKSKSKIQLGIVGIGAVLLIVGYFYNPILLEVFLGSLFAGWISAVRAEGVARRASRKKLEEEIDSFSGENLVDEVLSFLPPPVEISVCEIDEPTAGLLSPFLPRSSAKKSKLVSHLGAALRALTLAPSFPRLVLSAA